MQELGVCRILSCFVEWWELAVNPGHLLGKWGSGWSQRSCWGENDIIWSLGKAELQLHGTAPVLAFSVSSFIIKGYKGSPNTAGWGHGSLIQTDWDLLLSCRVWGCLRETTVQQEGILITAWTRADVPGAASTFPLHGWWFCKWRNNICWSRYPLLLAYTLPSGALLPLEVCVFPHLCFHHPFFISFPSLEVTFPHRLQPGDFFQVPAERSASAL